MEISQQTQETLSKYGVKPSKISNVQNQKTENVNEIKIVQPVIPISKPQIKVSSPEITVEKYKKWLSQSYQRQAEESKKSIKSLRLRDLDLSRLSDRVFRKIETIGYKLKEGLSDGALDHAIKSSLWPTLLRFGIEVLPIFWDPIMEGLASFEMGFRSFFGLGFKGTDLQKYNCQQTKGATFVKSLKRFLGVDDPTGEKSFIRCVGELAMSGVKHLTDYLGILVSERGDLIEALDKPKSLGIKDKAALALGKLTGNTKNFLKYFGDVLGIALGGEWYVKNHLMKNQEDDFNKEMKESHLDKTEQKIGKDGIVKIDGDYSRYDNKKVQNPNDKLNRALRLSALAMNAADDTNKINSGTLNFAITKLSEMSEEEMVPVIPGFIDLLDNKSKQSLIRSKDIILNSPNYHYEQVFRNKSGEVFDPVESGHNAYTWKTSSGKEHKVTSRPWVEKIWELRPGSFKRATDVKDSWRNTDKVPAKVTFVSKKALNSILNGNGREKLYDRLERLIKERYKRKIGSELKTTERDFGEKYSKYEDIMASAQNKINALNSEDTAWNNMVNNVAGAFGYNIPNNITYGETLPANGAEVNEYNKGKKLDIKSAISRMGEPISTRQGKFLTNSPLTDTHSHSGCAAGVRNFLEAGGLNTTGNPNLAKDYDNKNFLLQLGFQKIGGDEVKDFMPGDIAVLQPGPLDNPKEPGHISMFNGTDWISDFNQGHSPRIHHHGGRDYGSMSIFRFPQANDVSAKQKEFRSHDKKAISKAPSKKANSKGASSSYKSKVSSEKHGEHKNSKVSIVFSGNKNYKFGDTLNLANGSGVTYQFQPKPVNGKNLSFNQSGNDTYAYLDKEGYDYIQRMAELSKEDVYHKMNYVSGFGQYSSSTQVYND